MRVVIVGAGGHGKVVLDILRAHGRKFSIAGFIDADESLIGTKIAGIPVLGSANLLPKLRRRKITGAIVAIGDNRSRAGYVTMITDAGLTPVNAIHPRSTVSRSATLGRNVVIAAGAVVCAEARVSDGVIINTAAVVDHECEVGAMSHICPTAALAGRVRVGQGAFVGLGAKVIQCVTLGEWCTIGAGAVVTGDIPENVTAVGIPARII